MKPRKFNTKNSTSAEQWRDQILDALKEFNDDEWIDYLQKLCFDLKPIPSLQPISRELIEQLFWVYNSLNLSSVEAKLRFSKSLLQFLRNIPPQLTNNKLIYDLIYFVHETRPIEQRDFLKLIIEDGSFKNLSFGSDNLHLLLVKSYIYLEDREKLHLEWDLLSNLTPKAPYSLYVVMFYYSYLGHAKKALDTFTECLMHSEWTETEESCNEIYNTLVDCIPKYVSLSEFYDYLRQKGVFVQQSNTLLCKAVDDFIDQLPKTKQNTALVLLLKGNLKRPIKIDENGEIIPYLPIPIDKPSDVLGDSPTFEDLEGYKTREIAEISIEQVNYLTDQSRYTRPQ
jgi:hypothetical protein